MVSELLSGNDIHPENYNICLLHIVRSCFIFVPYFEKYQRVSELLSRHDFHTEIYIGALLNK